MGMKTMEEMVAKLREAGRGDDTPTAVVQWATHPKQRTVTGTLATIADACAEENIGSPSIIIVGEVVRLRDDFDWFGENPA